MISYRPLHITLAAKEIKKTKMAEDIGMTSTTLAKFAKNEPIKFEVLNQICKYLDCRVEDVIEYVPDK